MRFARGAGRRNTELVERITTVSIIRIGATKEFSDGWEAAFGGKRSKSKSAAGGAVTKKKAVKKKSPKSTKRKAATKKKTAKKKKARKKT